MTRPRGVRPSSARRPPGPGRTSDDRAISSIVAEILLVALALVLAAGAWLFFGGFTDAASSDDVPEDAVRAAAHDADADGDADWIRLTMVKAGGGPFDAGDVSLTLVRHGTGASYGADAATQILCNGASAATAGGSLVAGCASEADNFLHASSSQADWDAGQSLYVPCQDDDTHGLTLTLDETLVLSVETACGEAAA